MMTSERTGAAGMSDTEACEEVTADDPVCAQAPPSEGCAPSEASGGDVPTSPARPRAEAEARPPVLPSDAPLPLPELREYAPLDALLDLLPRKAQRAQRAGPAITVEFTCLDVGPDLIVLGANFSMVFVCDRRKNNVIKLRCDDRSCRITCVKLLTRIDHQIAVGTSSGQVEVYLLPTQRPGQVIEEVRKFLIDGGHKSNVTCVEWSANGMKLFTGDSVGNVVFSEVDMYENTCKSALRIKEDMPIVQLNYAHKILIVSTYARTLLCYTDENYRLQQVGQQPRKTNGHYGGHFVPGLCKARDATLCATRPGLRLWHAGTDGAVRATLKFKHLLAAQHQTVALLPSTRHSVLLTDRPADPQFGPVLFYRGRYVLTWSQDLLAVLELEGPRGARMVASSVGDLGSIITAAVTGEEIYILRRGPGRQLIRVATSPDVFEEKEELTLSEAEQLMMSAGLGGQPGGSSPDSPKKAGLKQGLSAVRSIFSKARDELADTTAKLSLPKFGRLEPGERGSASAAGSTGSSRRGSRDEDASVSVGETPDAALSAEVLVARFAGRDQRPVAPEVRPEPSARCPSPAAAAAESSDPAAEAASEAIGEEVAAEKQTKATLSEDRLLKIGQESFEDILFHPNKSAKKKKKKSRKTLKKGSADRSCTPSPTPDGEGIVRTRCVSDPERGQTESPLSDSVSPSPERGRSHSQRSNGHPEEEEEEEEEEKTRSGSTQSSGSQEPPSIELDSHPENGSDSHHPDGAHPTAAPRSRSGMSGSVNDDGSGEHDSESTLPGGVHSDQAASGKVVLGGVISSSVDDVATRMATPVASDTPGISPMVFPGTLRSWESAPDNGDAALGRGGAGNPGDDGNDTIHTLRSDMSSLQLDLGMAAPAPEAAEPSLQFKGDDQEWSPTSPAGNPTGGAAATERTDLRRSESTDEEFYGKYLAAVTPGSEAGSPPGVFSVEESPPRPLGLRAPAPEEPPPAGADHLTPEELHIPENIQQRFAGSWMQCSTPGYVVQLVVSDKHVWCVDNRDKVYHALVANVAVSWSKLKDPAMLIATSPSGNIVWRLHRKSGTAFASAPISPHTPVGSRWTKASVGVASVCLDESVAWIVKQSGEICVHKSISRDLPLTRDRKLHSNAFVTQIAANRGVVWAIGSNRKIMYRGGITPAKTEGERWEDLDEDSVKLQFVSIALDSRKVGWAIDEDGLVWFRTGVTPTAPRGDDMKWWQVPMGEYLMQDPNTLKMLLNIAGTNATVDRMTTWLKRQYYRATHIAASASSVWVCGSYHYRSSLHFSKGNLLGSRWENGCPVGLPLSAFWVSVSTTGVYGPSGMVWAAIKSGEVFCFPPDNRKPLQVDPPLAGVIFKHLSATPETLWALQEDGSVYVRKQITDRCPQGLAWKKLGLEQLGCCKIVHFSCGTEVVWACDNEGTIYLRIGVHVPSEESLPPAWVPLGRRGGPGQGAHFVQVFCSLDNRLVWALDSKRAVYVRRGICKELPVGRDWEVVEGTQAIHLCISSSTVWALCPNGDVACRFGITEKNIVGDYWKKVPGTYTYLSVSQSDDLWAISHEGKLFQRFTKMFQRRGTPPVEQQASPLGEDDWELL